MDRPDILAQEFAYYAECQLATLEIISERKSTSKSDLRRQAEIAFGMVKACQRHGVQPISSPLRTLPRLKEHLARLEQSQERGP